MLHFIVQLWLSILTFTYGFLMDGAIVVAGLCSMEVVPKSLAGSAHGLACAVAQSKCASVKINTWINIATIVVGHQILIFTVFGGKFSKSCSMFVKFPS